MKRRQRDDILEQVLDGQGTTELQSGTETVSQERALLEDMRLGLKGLARQGLEPNRSVESLRRAILEQGLQPGRSAPIWAWAGPAAALGVATYLFVAQAGKTNTNLPPVVSAPVVESFADNSLDTRVLDFQTRNEDKVAAVSEGSQNTPEPPRPRTNEPSHRSIGSRLASAATTLAATVAAAAPKAADVATESAAGAISELDGPRSAEPGLMMAAGPTDGGDAQIILIDSAEDTETGASAATELESAANVVVGG